MSFLNTDILLIWRLIIEEYGPYIYYTQGNKSIVAYALSLKIPKILHKNPFIKRKLCQKSMTLKSYLKLFPL